MDDVVPFNLVTIDEEPEKDWQDILDYDDAEEVLGEIEEK